MPFSGLYLGGVSQSRKITLRSYSPVNATLGNRVRDASKESDAVASRTTIFVCILLDMELARRVESSVGFVAGLDNEKRRGPVAVRIVLLAARGF